MKMHPRKEEKARKQIFDMYGYCDESLFFHSKVAVAKKLDEQTPDLEKHLADQEVKRQATPKPSWMRDRAKKKDDTVSLSPHNVFLTGNPVFKSAVFLNTARELEFSGQKDAILIFIIDPLISK